MKAGHELKMNAATFDKVCVKCHDSEGTTTLTGDNFVQHFLEPQKEVYLEAVKLALQLMKDNYGILMRDSSTSNTFSTGIYGISAYDLTLDPTGGTSAKDWTRGGTLTADQARNLLGAAFNLKLVTNDPAAYAHARTYVRRILYDTIDFLDNRVNDLSVGQTALAVSGQAGKLVTGKYTKGAAAYTDGTLTVPGAGTSESMLYLIGWSRSTGAWNAIERP